MFQSLLYSFDSFTLPMVSLFLVVGNFLPGVDLFHIAYIVMHNKFSNCITSTLSNLFWWGAGRGLQLNFTMIHNRNQTRQEQVSIKILNKKKSSYVLSSYVDSGNLLIDLLTDIVTWKKATNKLIKV